MRAVELPMLVRCETVRGMRWPNQAGLAAPFLDLLCPFTARAPATCIAHAGPPLRYHDDTKYYNRDTYYFAHLYTCASERRVAVSLCRLRLRL